MALDLNDLSKFILPLVEDGKQEDAKKLLQQVAEQPDVTRSAGAQSQTKGGMLDMLGGLLGGDDNNNSNSGGGIMDAIGGLLGGDNGNNGGGGIMDAIGGLLGGGNNAAHANNNNGGGLMGMLGGLLGSSSSGGGLLDSIGGLLGSGKGSGISGLLAVLPQLLGMIKPEHASSVHDYIAKTVEEEHHTPTVTRPTAGTNGGVAKTTVGSSSLRSTAKKPSTPKTPSARASVEPKRPAGSASRTSSSAPTQRPAIHRPTKP